MLTLISVCQMLKGYDYKGDCSVISYVVLRLNLFIFGGRGDIIKPSEDFNGESPSKMGFRPRLGPDKMATKKKNIRIWT